MGREIIFEVQVDGERFYFEDEGSLYVCGRDDATEYMARLCEYTDKGILYLTCSDYERYLSIKEELKEYYDKDMFEIQKARDAIEDLREARRHALNSKIFSDFSDVMDNTYEWIEQNNWSRAGSMIEYLDKCYNKMLDLVNANTDEDRLAVIEKYKVAIIWSE